jgi:CheY-like chemotaxis protein
MAKHDLRPICILIADDDADDRLLVKDAFQESDGVNNLRFVENGVELLDYLRKQGKYKDASDFPDLVLLDLNMPRKDGREVLQEIKNDPNLRHLPVVILTTSKAEEDILRSYDMGAAGYITKPVTFEGLIEITKGLSEYWLQIVRLPLKKA